MNYNTLSQGLIQWYELYKRDLPWRSTKNPYFIWLSEIILQQTRVSQGLPYYMRFIDQYPTLNQLASANENEVLRLWQGLGYYSRARNMLNSARFIADHLNGEFPTSFNEIIKLKGVGRYTAGAIASFAFGESVPVVDGNVMRVLSRIFGIHENTAGQKGQKVFLELAEKLLPDKQSDTFNQAIMEFGATVCLPKKPLCKECIFNGNCYAFQKGLVSSLPVKIKKLQKKVREFSFFVIKYKNNLLMQHRQSEDIWKGLFQFYLHEKHSKEFSDFLPDPILDQLLVQDIRVNGPSETITHILTHQIIKAEFWEIEIENKPKHDLSINQSINFFSIEEIVGLPKPVLINKYLNKKYF